MAGHPARDRVDRVLDLDATLLEEVGQLADRALGLGDRQAVTGHDDDALAVGQQDGRVLGGDLPDRLLAFVAGPAISAPPPARSAEEDVGDGAVHRPRHEQREERAGGADQGTGDDQCLIVEHETGERRREAGQGVQDGDDDRHVRAADRQHEQGAEAREAEEEDQQRHARLDGAEVERR